MSEVEVAKSGHVATVTLNRPERRNALSRSLMESIIAACEKLRRDDEARVVVIQASGRDFSVGVDLHDPVLAAVAQAPIGERRRLLQVGPEMVRSIQALPQTTIAAMHGYCLGGGGCVALACDLRVVGSDLRFGMPEVLRGMNMSWRTVPLMVATFGATRTKELLLTKCYVESDRALIWGLANRTIDGSGPEVQAAAGTWAREIAASVPPIAATMIKETVNAVANAHTAMVHMDTDQYILAQHTDDFREAVAAFLEKRDPEYRGR